MSQVTWFKVLTDIFADDKIKIIQSMPEGDSILIMWFKVLSQAGKTNDGGYIYLRKNIPYTTNMLATLFEKPPMLVELALKTFSQFEMIDIDDRGYIFVTNWEKHQNIEGMNKVREQTRKRVADHRERKRLELQAPDEGEKRFSNVTVTDDLTQSNALDIDKELDLEKHIYTTGEIQNFLDKYTVQYAGIYNIEVIQSYGGVLESSFILQAIQKSEGKNTGYVIKILKEMVKSPDNYREEKSGRGKSSVGKSQKAAYRQDSKLSEQDRLRMERERPNEQPIIDL